MKIVASHQPHFNPYLGYIAKMKMADVFILSDDVQFTKSGFIHRNKIRSWQSGNRWRWLTLPVSYGSQSTIDQVHLADGVDVMDKLANILTYEYQSAPYFSRTYSFLDVLAQDTEVTRRLSFFAYLSLGVFGYMMGVLPSVRLASTLRCNHEPGDKNGRLIALTKRVGGDAYLAGAEAARAYLNPKRFADAGIKLLAMEYMNPEYAQIHGGAFIPKMGVVDALMNCGNDARGLVGPEHYRVAELN